MMKGITILLLVIYGPTSYGSFKADSSLSSQQKAAFDIDIQTLKSFTASKADAKTKLAIGTFDLSGKGLYSLLDDNLIAVAPETFKPIICLHKETVDKILLGSKDKQLKSELQKGRISTCAPSIGKKNYARSDNINTSGNKFDISKTLDAYSYYESFGYKGGLYFTDGRFLPQNFEEQKILLLSTQLNPEFSGLGRDIPINLSGKPLSYYRLSDYFSELLPRSKLDNCLINNKSIKCETTRNGKYSVLSAFLMLFSDNCQDCQNDQITLLRFLSADALSYIKGDPTKNIQLRKLIELHKRDFKSLNLNYKKLIFRSRLLLSS